MSPCLGFAVLLTIYGLAATLLRAWYDRTH